MKIRKKTNQGPTGVSVRFKQMAGFDRPAFSKTLKFPNDVTQLTAANVSELLGKYTQMYTFVNQELCSINVRILELQTAESVRRNAVFRMNPSMNQQERWKRDAVLDSDKGLEKLVLELSQAKQEREQASMFLANYDRYITALSRELSRKTQEGNMRRG